MRTVLIDFDGVLHSYTSGWQGASSIPDTPNPGAIEFLEELLAAEDIEPVIWTSRVHCKEHEDPAVSENARIAIKQWLYLQGMGPDEVNRLKITNEKPPAVMLIDDRAFKFEGIFPTPDAIREFQPWNVKDEPPEEKSVRDEPDLRARVQHLVDYVSMAEDEGGFTFPDGDFWPESKS